MVVQEASNDPTVAVLNGVGIILGGGLAGYVFILNDNKKVLTHKAVLSCLDGVGQVYVISNLVEQIRFRRNEEK